MVSKKQAKKQGVSLRLPKHILATLDHLRHPVEGAKESRQVWITDAVQDRVTRERNRPKSLLPKEELADEMILVALTPELLKQIDRLRVSPFGEQTSRNKWITESIKQKIERAGRVGRSTERTHNPTDPKAPFSSAQALFVMQQMGWSRLHLLVGFEPSNGWVDFRKMLTEELQQATYDLNQVDTMGWSALHYAASRDASELNLVEILLKHPQIDINAMDFRKNTPLHYAVLSSNKTAVKSLLKDPKIDLSLRNSDGKTACDLAQSKEAPALVALLSKRNTKDRSQ